MGKDIARDSDYGPKVKINGRIRKGSQGFYWVVIVDFLTIKQRTEIDCGHFGLFFKTGKGCEENMNEVAYAIAFELQIKFRHQGGACDILDKRLVN